MKLEHKTETKTKLMERRMRRKGISYAYSLFLDRRGYSMQAVELVRGRYVKCVLVGFTEDRLRAEGFFTLVADNCVSAVHLSDVYEDEFP